MSFANALSLGALPALLLLITVAACDRPRDPSEGSDAGEAAWTELFNGTDFTGWRGLGRDDVPSDHWVVEDGAIRKVASGEVPVAADGQPLEGGDLMTIDTFEDFELSFEWRVSEGGNSGIKYNVSEELSTAHPPPNAALGFEYQILDDERHPDADMGASGNRRTAGLYDLIGRDPAGTLNPSGEWNEGRIVFSGNHGEHWLNGVKVVEFDLVSPRLDSLLAASKYATIDEFADRRTGHIVLQDHGDNVWFRNIRIRELPSPVLGSAVDVVPKTDEQRVDVLVGGELFTTYLYADDIAVLRKPVLFPIHAPGGGAITRGFPLDPKPGERTDHPHQIGLWFNYGNVNGLDFWNNSDAIPPERQGEMGSIRHREIVRASGGNGQGELEVVADWLDPNGERLLEERTRFVFHADEEARVIDRITTLQALDQAVRFPDNKEGVLGLRVTRALEMPTEEPIRLTDASGIITEVPVLDNAGVTGSYRNSEGVSGYPDVWGRRASWTALSGVVDGDSVTVVIIDHPDNVGYPTYWHARDYGLFAANPLGQKELSDGAEELDFALEPGASTTFRHRVVLFSGDPSDEEIERRFEDFGAQG